MIKFCSNLARKLQTMGKHPAHSQENADSAAAEEALLTAVLGPQHWLTQPNLEDARAAITAGAIGCKVTPIDLAQSIAQDHISAAVRRHVQDTATAFSAVDAYLQHIAELAEIFMTRFAGIDGNQGWVAVEVASKPANDPATLITDARALRDVADNVMPMVSATAAGLDAIEHLIAENTPLMVTDVVSISQVDRLAEAYANATAATGFAPAVVVDYTPQTFNETLQEVVRSYGDYVSPEALAVAGTSLAQHLHERFEQLDCHCYHLIDDAHPGAFGEKMFDCAFAMDLGALWAVEDDDSQPLDWRKNRGLIDELTDRIPEFSEGWKVDGLATRRFADFAPVRHKHQHRELRWQNLLDTISEQQTLVG